MKRISIGAPAGSFTLAEVREFVASCDHAGLEDSAVIIARTNIGGKVRELIAERPDTSVPVTSKTVRAL
jgi:hypothetical protein